MKKNEEMSERQAARFIEMYENAIKNGERWAHDIFLHRGTAKYEKTLETLNKAFEIKSMKIVIQPLPAEPGEQVGSLATGIRRSSRS